MSTGARARGRAAAGKLIHGIPSRLANGWPNGRENPVVCKENVVALTTLVHLSGQLSNLRHELRSLFDAL